MRYAEMHEIQHINKRKINQNLYTNDTDDMSGRKRH